MDHTTPDSVSLPCVVQLGFAGARRLFDEGLDNTAELEADLQRQLVAVLQELPQELKLGPHHFFCGISQMAVGADMVFTKACAELGITQRIFLPQHREEFLNATNSEHVPDFAPEEKAQAEQLLASPHIIQQRLVGHSDERHVRFEEANFEIVNVSDVVVCLLREDQELTAAAGGTSEMLELARRRRRPVVELRVGVDNGRVQLTKKPVHWPPARTEADSHNKQPNWPPSLPHEIDPSVAEALPPTEDNLPSSNDYCKPLKDWASKVARGHSRFFKGVALLIILSHILATVLATLALVLHEESHAEPSDEIVASQVAAGHDGPEPTTHESRAIIALLAIELLLLAGGLSTHLYLHRSHAAKRWALARLIAEVLRSLLAIGNRHMYLEHLFHLALPFNLRPLMRTLSVLHLRSTHGKSVELATEDRDQFEELRYIYVNERLLDPLSGQIPFYQRAIAQDQQRLWWCSKFFLVLSLGAFLMTAAKLTLLLNHLHGSEASLLKVLGTLAVALPVLAVAALTWSAALDTEARLHTFTETLEFLEEQLVAIREARSGYEFNRLLLETETRLLGETASWFSRRSYIGVS